MSLSSTAKYLFLIAFIIVFGYILYVNISDIIYGFSLLLNKQYYSKFDFLSLTPPSSRRANIIAQGVYSGISISSALEILKQNLLALDFEVAIFCLTLALIIKYQMPIAKLEKEKNVPSDLTYKVSVYYFYTLLVTTLATTFIVINNLIPFHGIQYYCFWFGLITAISAIIKLILSLIIAYFLFFLFKRKVLDVKIQEVY